MQKEEEAAQSAKLQELIRRGGPEDLQEANRLMKVMAGYDTRHKTDYRAKAAEEVSKVQQKARLLEERLQNFKEGDTIAEGDVFEVYFGCRKKRVLHLMKIQDLANALQSAQPKIQKMCEEESDDAEAVNKLLEINDSIHRTIERYKLIKQGDIGAASKIPKGTLGTSTGVSKNADNELSLIDFGGDEPSSTPSISTNGGNASKTESLEDDLLGLSMQDNAYGQGGGIALGFGANTSKSLCIHRDCELNKVQTCLAHRYYLPRRSKIQREHRRRTLQSNLNQALCTPNQTTTHSQQSQIHLPHLEQQPLAPPSHHNNPHSHQNQQIHSPPCLRHLHNPLHHLTPYDLNLLLRLHLQYLGSIHPVSKIRFHSRWTTVLLQMMSGISVPHYLMREPVCHQSTT